MKTTAPKELGILTVAGVFGFIALALSFAVFDYGLLIACIIGVVVATVVAIALTLGWREPAEGPSGPRDLSPKPPVVKTPTPANNPAPRATGVPHSASTLLDPTPASAARDQQGRDTTPTTQAQNLNEGSAKISAAPASAYSDSADKNDDTTSSSRTTSKAAVVTPSAAAATPSMDPGTATAPLVTPEATNTTAPAAAAPESKPETLSAARGGQPDDLKLLKGVGPKLESTLHDLGFYHFDQVAAWGPREVAWVDSRLPFKGRIERDGWIEQAKILAKTR